MTADVHGPHPTAGRHLLLIELRDMADVICLSPSHLHVDGSLGICVGESWREFESRYFGRLVEAMRRIFADEMGFLCLRASASDRQRRVAEYFASPD